LLVLGTHKGPLPWKRGTPLRLPDGSDPEKALDPNEPRPRLWYSPDGKHLAFAPAAGGLQLWDAAVTRFTPAPLEEGGKPSPALAVCFAGEGKALWACHADGTVRSWSLPDLRLQAAWPLEAPTTRPLTAAAFPGGG